MSATSVQRAVHQALVADVIATLRLDPIVATLEMLGFKLLPVHLPSRRRPGRTRVRLAWRSEDGDGVFTVRYSRTVRLP